jgi:D-alanyl-lipoteichoic acid acyltransferase DltB (MBOAT superfamily)
MAYADVSFWLFLGLVLLGVLVLPPKARPFWLIATSLWFYAAPDTLRLLWLGGVVGACAAALAAPVLRKPVIAALILALVWAKFPDAIFPNAWGLPDPHLPPGLSFYSFTAIALLVQGLRRTERLSLSELALHLVWFPKLLAGPIERAQALVPQFPALSVQPRLATLGCAFLLSGLIKKFVIADSLAPMVDAAFAIPAHAAPVDLLLSVYFFAFQIYGDFSGYADMAIGLSALVGLRLSRNFDRPYLSPTVSEFWASRWHITLGQWFRDFVYVPLGGSRRGRTRQVVNLMVVFLLSGLWHAGLGYGVGWGFVVWGGLNGAFVATETVLPAPKRPVSRVFRGVLTFHLVLITWVFFRAASVSDALTILSRLGESLSALPSLIMRYPFTADHGLGLSFVAGLLLIELACGSRPAAERLVTAPLALRWAGLYGALVLLLVFGRWQGSGFIYAGF